MKNSFKALLGAALVSCVMFGCETTQSRDCDGKSCGTAQCDGTACGKEMACKDGCTKACCADKVACTHPNSTFSCPKCVDGKHCCPDCAAKDAAACPDCQDKAHAMACPDCKDGVKCAHCQA